MFATLFHRAPDPRADSGMTLIEVIVSALLVALIAIGTLTGLTDANKVAGNERVHAQATTIAQQNEEQLRGAPLFGRYGLAKFGESTKTVAENGLCVEQVSGGWRYSTKAALSEKAASNTCEKTVVAEAYATEAEKGAKYTNTVFTVKSSGEFYPPGEEGSTCKTEKGNTEVIKTTSSVTWTGNPGKEVTQSSFVKVPANYGLLVKVKNRNNEAVAGAKVVVETVTEPHEILGEQTTPYPSGCVVFGALAENVDVYAEKGNWVNFNGKVPKTAPQEKVLKTSAVTSTEPTIEAPGSLVAEFVEGSGKSVESFTFVASHPTGGMSSPTFLVGGSSTQHTSDELSNDLFPFVEPGTPWQDSKYTVYAGSCEKNNPLTVTGGKIKDPSVQVEPNLPASAKIEAPPVTVTIWEGQSASNKGAAELAESTSAKIIDTACKGEPSQNYSPVPYEYTVQFKKGVPFYLPYAAELELCVVGHLSGGYYKNEFKLTNTEQAGTAATDYLKAPGSGYEQSSTALTC